jgi:hypothetical protein
MGDVKTDLPASASAPAAAASPKKRYSVNDFKKIKTIGRGAFGEVQVVRMKATGQICRFSSFSLFLIFQKC